jgi:hypothetical protein
MRVPVLLLALGVAIAAPAAAAAKPKPGPIDATVEVDRSKAVSQTITPAAGGTISLETGRGRLSIEFAPNTVAEDTTVTATPVTKLDSPRTRKGLVAGVQLGPEGLQLGRPATVSLDRKGKAPKGTSLVAVGSEGDGSDVYRLPPPVKQKGKGRKATLVPTGEPKVFITHFSTVEFFAWGTRTIKQLDGINHPEVGIHQVHQEISEILGDKSNPTRQQDAKNRLDELREQLIDPLVQTALLRLRPPCSVSAIEYAQTVMRTTLMFERQVQLMGAGFVPSSDASTLLEQIGTCMASLCPTIGDPRIGSYFLSVLRNIQIMGGFDGAFYDAMIENAFRCAAFEVRLDEHITYFSPNGNYELRTAGAAKVKPTRDGGTVITPGPLPYNEASGTITAGCVKDEIESTNPGVLGVQSVELTAFDPDQQSNDRVASLRLRFPTAPSENIRSTGSHPCAPGPTHSTQAIWHTGFGVFHPQFQFPGTDFLPGEPPVFATAIYPGREFSSGGGGFRENGKIELVHTPEQPIPVPPPNVVPEGSGGFVPGSGDTAPA